MINIFVISSGLKLKPKYDCNYHSVTDTLIYVIKVFINLLGVLCSAQECFTHKTAVSITVVENLAEPR